MREALAPAAGIILGLVLAAVLWISVLVWVFNG